MQRFYIFILGILLLLFPKSIFAAAELIISNAPETIDHDQPFDITISFSGEPAHYAQKNYFLRAVLASPNSNKYFGYTKNNHESWGNTGTDKALLYQIETTLEGSWSGILTAKVDLESSYFSGAGQYELKVGRYTSDSDTSADWSESKIVKIHFVPSPTPAPTQAPTTVPSIPPPRKLSEISFEPTITQIQISPSTTPIPIRILGSTTEFLATSSSPVKVSTQAGIISLSHAEESTESSSVQDLDENKLSRWPLIFIVGGLALTGVGVLTELKEMLDKFRWM